MKISFNALKCGGYQIASEVFAIAIVVIVVDDAATATVIVMIARTDIVIVFDLNAFRFIAAILKPNFHLCCG